MLIICYFLSCFPYEHSLECLSGGRWDPWKSLCCLLALVTQSHGHALNLSLGQLGLPLSVQWSCLYPSWYIQKVCFTLFYSHLLVVTLNAFISSSLRWHRYLLLIMFLAASEHRGSLFISKNAALKASVIQTYPILSFPLWFEGPENIRVIISSTHATNHSPVVPLKIASLLLMRNPPKAQHHLPRSSINSPLMKYWSRELRGDGQ